MMLIMRKGVGLLNVYHNNSHNDMTTTYIDSTRTCIDIFT